MLKKVQKGTGKMGNAKKILLLMPLVAGVTLLFVIKSGGFGSAGFELPSPAEESGLIIALIIFSVGYALFLAVLFYKDAARMFAGKKEN